MPLKKPPWISTSVDLSRFQEVFKSIRELDLHVVCFEASCPNIGLCFSRKTATFLILGDICTRNCAFCGIKQGLPRELDPEEPVHVAELIEELELRHVVITSVTRDDLEDQGVSQFIQTIGEIKKRRADVIIEVLIPDFQGERVLLDRLLQARPHIVNHNIETIARLYPKVRPQANYTRSLSVLKYVKTCNPAIYTKSGFMVGLGETDHEIQQLMRDLRDNFCDILTVGQYLRPSPTQLPVHKYYTPKEFESLRNNGIDLGFIHVAAAPLVRSSFNAIDFSSKFMG